MFNKLRLFIATALLFSVAQAKSDMYETIASINKGIDGYIVGKTLTKEQQKLLQKNSMESQHPSIKRFLANKTLLVAVNIKNNKVIAINKKLSNLKRDKVKALIAEYIHKFDEPTAMAHDKMLYWVYDKEGKKIQEDDLKQYKDSLKVKGKQIALAEAVNIQKKKIDFDPYLSVKLSSDKGLMSEQKEDVITNAYVMISSDKLISAILEVQ